MNNPDFENVYSNSQPYPNNTAKQQGFTQQPYQQPYQQPPQPQFQQPVYQPPKKKTVRRANTHAVGGWTAVTKALVYILIILGIIVGATLGGEFDDEVGWVLGVIVGAVVGVLGASIIMIIIEISQNARSILLELQELNDKL